MKIELITKSTLTGLLICLGMTLAHGQEDNLVPDPSFEIKDKEQKNLKGYGQLEEFMETWNAATLVPLDVFAAGAKSTRVQVPNNTYGTQSASDGSGYAGIRVYSKDPKSNRNYYQIELDSRLEKNQLYCVSFDISLSDLSRYAVNNIGAVFHDRETEQGNEGTLSSKNFSGGLVQHKTNKVMSLLDGWETVCGTVIGSGTEGYMIIGGFGSDNDMEVEKVKKPAGVYGTIENHAYYYLDNVSVVPIQAKSQCACSAADEIRDDEVYGGEMIPESATDEEVIALSTVYYAFLKRRYNAFDDRIPRMVEILKNNPTWKVKVIGHSDEDEFNEGKINPRYRDLGQKRADEMVKVFVEQYGMAADRFIVDPVENLDPATTSPDRTAENRRVVFQLVK